MATYPQLHAKIDTTQILAMNIPKITFTHTEPTKKRCTTKTKARLDPKSADNVAALLTRKSLASMSDEEIIQENLKELQDIKSRVSLHHLSF